MPHPSWFCTPLGRTQTIVSFGLAKMGNWAHAPPLSYAFASSDAGEIRICGKLEVFLSIKFF
jgi:hypothetical protein